MKKILIIALVLIWNYSNGQSDYFPVEKGKTWTYAFGAEIYKGTPYENYQSEVKILEDTETINGTTYFIAQNATGDPKGNKTTLISYFRFSDDGSLISKNSKNSEELIIMKKTPQVGDTYRSQNGGTSKVIDTNATLKTPESTYDNCLMLEIKEEQSTLRSYYQKNIGMIATTIIQNNTEKIFIYLISE
ncbi:MAG: hypothetical protein HRU40_01600 [Saprospiraceae bacterium]|nr:hypothetical protein [Saprospiraceae bacterium]